MRKSPEPIPDTLYRGIKLPIDNIDSSVFSADLLPGASPTIDENGNPLSRDGNEFGVYMSTNKDVAEMYAEPTPGEYMADSPVFNNGVERQYRDKLRVPVVGVLHEIKSDGLRTRSPYIKSSLDGHYNNGITGDEWITDVVSAEKHKVVMFKFGKDPLHKPKDIMVDGDPEKAMELVRAEIASRMGKLALLSKRLHELPDEKRYNDYTVRRLIEEIQAESDHSPV